MLTPSALPLLAEDHAPPGFLSRVAALVRLHRARLLAYARRRGLDAEAALDAVQDSFVTFLRLPAARIVASPEEALRLLTSVLRHEICNARRKQVRRARAAPQLLALARGADEETSEVLIERAEALGRARGCIVQMGSLQRRVVALGLLDEAPLDEVARRVGVSPVYARVLLSRARQHLRACELELFPYREVLDVDADARV